VVKIFTQINVNINRESRDRKLELSIPNLKPIIRIFCKIKFESLSTTEDAIIDTGAHISVIPYEVWSNMDVKIETNHIMKGAIPGKEMPVKVGYVKAKLVDENNKSRDISFLSYLALTNKVPLILGMRDLLEKFDLHILFSENKSYLEQVV
jgi:predicted aspartyl protease|tara:strand:- start:96 stop:548 length:453 start_codon:yes stop_codon:yes gene_type:complete